MELIKALYHYTIACLAVLLYRYPAQKLIVIAVTGTSGKTTTSHLIFHILRQAGYNVALISSVEAIVSGKSYETGFHVTTPDPLKLQKFLRLAVDTGCKYMVLEASSHGIAQSRLIGCNIAIGVITNIAHEHLDWHKTFASYARAKLTLLKISKTGLVNRDDTAYELLQKDNLQDRKIYTYSWKGHKGADFTRNNTPYKVAIPGDYNEENALAAASVGKILGVNSRTTAKALAVFKGVTGRFEEIKNSRGLDIIVDFAHKPNAFEALLKTLNKRAKRRIIIMFGSAGERDVQKRSIMGEIAAKYADIIVLTAEDPRSEKVDYIIEKIAHGCLEGGAREGKGSKFPYFIKIPDRAAAIDYTINTLAKKGDTIAFLGKSHEKTMAFGTREYPWSEHEQINKALGKS